jgi:hypothetical protein
MNSEEIEASLQAVGAKLSARGLAGAILLTGGAYMTLVIKNRSATKAVDAYLAEEQEAIREAAAEVAEERGLPVDWLNDAVKGFMYIQAESSLWASYPGLDIYAPAMDYIFAMKAEAARAGTSDFGDLIALRDALGLKGIDEALAVIARYIPANRLTSKTQLTIETLFQDED